MKSQIDPVTAYAQSVIAGATIAGRMVRQACQRHLDDLRDGPARGLVWDAAAALEACDFFPEVLCLPEESDSGESDDEDDAEVIPEAGTPFVLTPYQQFIIGSLFGWFAERVSKRTGKISLRQRFRIAYFEGAKGCGKTPMGAGILIYMLIRHGTRGAQLFCAAVTKDQAKLAFADCEKMVQASPALRELIDKKVNNLAVLSTGSFIRPISSEKRGLDGKRVQGAVIDELHEHPSSMVVAKVRAGIKGRPNALIFIPTNSGFDRESICWEYHEYSRQVLDGTIQNDSWFAYVCGLDPCEKCRAAGKQQPADDCADCDSWKIEGPHWLKANPNLGVSLPWDYLREQVREAINLPSQRNMVQRLNFCIWTAQVTLWITPEKWAACKGTASSASLVGRECFIGVDLSSKIDLTAVVLMFPKHQERAIPVDLGPEAGTAPGVRTEARKTLNMNVAYDLLPFFWLPRDTLTERVNEDNVPYDRWEKEGALFVTTGNIVDQDEILAYIIGTLAKKYKIIGFGFDPANATQLSIRLIQEFGPEKVTEIPQGFKYLSEPSKVAEALVAAKWLNHDANPVMAMCVANSGKEENAWQDIRPVKINQRKRMDGWMATIIALAIAIRQPVVPVSVYATRGVRTLGQ